jgi:transcriptional regulator with XRE-family HTH domain
VCIITHVESEDPERVAGREIQRLRSARGWSQAEAARRMKPFGYDFNQALISRIELGQRPLRVNELADFARLFGVTVPFLLFPHISLGEAEAEIARLEQDEKEAEQRARDLQPALNEAENVSYELNRIRARLAYLRERRDTLRPGEGT